MAGVERVQLFELVDHEEPTPGSHRGHRAVVGGVVAQAVEHLGELGGGIGPDTHDRGVLVPDIAALGRTDAGQHPGKHERRLPRTGRADHRREAVRTEPLVDLLHERPATEEHVAVVLAERLHPWVRAWRQRKSSRRLDFQQAADRGDRVVPQLIVGGVDDEVARVPRLDLELVRVAADRDDLLLDHDVTDDAARVGDHGVLVGELAVVRAREHDHDPVGALDRLLERRHRHHPGERGRLLGRHTGAFELGHQHARDPGLVVFGLKHEHALQHPVHRIHHGNHVIGAAEIDARVGRWDLPVVEFAADDHDEPRADCGLEHREIAVAIPLVDHGNGDPGPVGCRFHLVDQRLALDEVALVEDDAHPVGFQRGNQPVPDPSLGRIAVAITDEDVSRIAVASVAHAAFSSGEHPSASPLNSGATRAR